MTNSRIQFFKLQAKFEYITNILLVATASKYNVTQLTSKNNRLYVAERSRHLIILSHIDDLFSVVYSYVFIVCAAFWRNKSYVSIHGTAAKILSQL